MNRSIALMLILWSACCAAPRAVCAAPEVQFLFSAGGQRGQTVAVSTTGKFAVWPLRAWVDRTGLEVAAAAEKGALSIRVADDAEPGVYWVRLFDETGASAPRPFVVGTIPEATEKEPNNALDVAQGFDGDPAAVTVNGQLNRGGDVDVFAFAAKAGQTLVADLDAQSPLDSPLDAVLQIVSPEGFVFAQNDDQQGLDPRLAVQIPADGVWRVRVFGFPAEPNQSIELAGSDRFVYRLTMTTGPYVDFALPLAVERLSRNVLALHGWNIPADSAERGVSPPEQRRQFALDDPLWANVLQMPIVRHTCLVAREQAEPQVVSWPVTLSGQIERPGDGDEFALPVKTGDALIARIESRELGFDLDPVLELLDAEGKSLAKVDDTGNSRDAELSYTAAADGQIRLRVSDLHRGGGERFVYRLSIERFVADFRLTCDAHQVVLAAGGTFELPVAIERLNGHAAAITVAVEGLPAGVTVAEATSQAGDDSAKKVTLKFAAAVDAPLAGLPVRIVGRVADQPPRMAKIAVPEHAQAELTDLWLAVVGAAK